MAQELKNYKVGDKINLYTNTGKSPRYLSDYQSHDLYEMPSTLVGIYPNRSSGSGDTYLIGWTKNEECPYDANTIPNELVNDP